MRVSGHGTEGITRMRGKDSCSREFKSSGEDTPVFLERLLWFSGERDTIMCQCLLNATSCASLSADLYILILAISFFLGGGKRFLLHFNR